MTRPTEICKLCHKEKLLCKSHILPEVLYQFCYHDDGKIRMFNEEYDDRIGHIFSGRWEYMLCEVCEKFLNDNYEDYATKVLYGGALDSIEIKGRITIYKNVDYLKFKLFQISLLWRLSVSSDALGRDVNLGAHEDILRNMLLNKEPGDVNEYPCFMTIPMIGQRWLNDFISGTESHVIDGHDCFRYLAGGFGFCHVMPKSPFTFTYPELFLQKDGTLITNRFPMEGTSFFQEYAISAHAIQENVAKKKEVKRTNTVRDVSVGKSA